ncbi:DUF805 domain-containing protein [Roseateles sp. So40a]|uniref:DUF805 domain-containing protein n=1 Tax=Roseateles sp. So40a TaxID=3400226 RepID=UPI003A8C536F
MTFEESIQTCFRKYADFTGTASRSEYWWFFLALVLGSAILGVISDSASLIFCLATLVPSVSAAARRLHDIDRSGWWQLIILVPVVGLFVLLYWLVQPTAPNRYEAENKGVATV